MILLNIKSLIFLFSALYSLTESRTLTVVFIDDILKFMRDSAFIIYLKKKGVLLMKPSILDNKMLHGADYNPDQWLDYPEVLEEDIRLMKLAHVNCVSLAIFAWARLEPEEGVYDFEWLGNIIEKLYQKGIYTLLATPSGARPAWMAQKYPEVLRVRNDLVRNHMGERHNHCYTSPVYREKVWEMNRELSERFGKHPGVIMWHISNEYGGDCYCPLCQDAFRNWLKEKYQTLDNLNRAWWSAFWSHTYTDWSQIEPPLAQGESNTHGLNLDWKRFVTYQTVDFCKWEIEAVRSTGSDLPTTANFMFFYNGLNYFKFKDVVDIVSWDNYPQWHKYEDEFEIATLAGCMHDLIRSIKKQPFLLMESSPSATNWQSTAKLKRPGMHMLSSLQAVAHGSNSVQYFQWRKSRGSSEKFHGAVVDHYGKEDTRVFSDVAELGKRLENLGELCSTNVKPEVAIIFDWENRWAYEDAHGPNKPNKYYIDAVLSHYKAFWEKGISVDIVDMESDFSDYKLVVAPMLYMYRAGIEEKLRSFVESGGVLVGGFWSGIVDENDLCFLGGMPGGGMMEVFGLRSEEIDSLFEGQYNEMEWNNKAYKLSKLCDLVKLSTASVLAEYQHDFYANNPALTVNNLGKGKAYYLCANPEQTFYSDFYDEITKEANVQPSIDALLPKGVTATLRKGKRDIAIVQNFNPEPAEVILNHPVTDMETGEKITETLNIPTYGVRFLVKH